MKVNDFIENISTTFLDSPKIFVTFFIIHHEYFIRIWWYSFYAFVTCLWLDLLELSSTVLKFSKKNKNQELTVFYDFLESLYTYSQRFY